MTVLPITLTIAGAAAILNIWLAARAARVRMKEGVFVGDGGNALLLARMRAHANYVEYTPFVLILLALVELGGGRSSWLWAISIAYIVGRLLHPFGIERGDANWMRGAGILATMAALLALAGYALYLPYAAVTSSPVIAV